MLIQLKQSEIEEALAMYIEAQGISLVYKTVSVAFTAGRKDSGLTADVEIEQINSTSTQEHVSIRQFHPQPQTYIVDVVEEAATPTDGEVVQEAASI